jgi:hypothetical protein
MHFDPLLQFESSLHLTLSPFPSPGSVTAWHLASAHFWPASQSSSRPQPLAFLLQSAAESQAQAAANGGLALTRLHFPRRQQLPRHLLRRKK